MEGRLHNLNTQNADVDEHEEILEAHEDILDSYCDDHMITDIKKEMNHQEKHGGRHSGIGGR